MDCGVPGKETITSCPAISSSCFTAFAQRVHSWLCWRGTSSIGQNELKPSSFDTKQLALLKIQMSEHFITGSKFPLTKSHSLSQAVKIRIVFGHVFFVSLHFHQVFLLQLHVTFPLHFVRFLWIKTSAQCVVLLFSFTLFTLCSCSTLPHQSLLRFCFF